MSIIAKNNDNESYEKMPLGNKQAVCVFVEDIGTHDGEYMGAPVRRHQVVVCWELAEKMREGENIDKPFMISKFYTLSLGEKANLRKDLDAWRGKGFTPEELKGFDIERLKGANCLLNIIENTKKDGSIGTKIASISPIMSGMTKISPFNLTPPEWIGKMREKSIEAMESKITEHGGGFESDSEEDDLPF